MFAQSFGKFASSLISAPCCLWCTPNLPDTTTDCQRGRGRHYRVARPSRSGSDPDVPNQNVPWEDAPQQQSDENVFQTDELDHDLGPVAPPVEPPMIPTAPATGWTGGPQPRYAGLRPGTDASPLRLRLWTDVSGRHQVRATLASAEGDYVYFRIAEGRLVRTARFNLSRQDQALISDWMVQLVSSTAAR